MVALFDCPPAEAWTKREIRDYLSDVARRGGMEFFAQVEEPVRRNTGLEVPATDLDEKALATLAGAVQRDVTAPRWGINE